jgi:hypothetical protein
MGTRNDQVSEVVLCGLPLSQPLQEKGQRMLCQRRLCRMSRLDHVAVDRSASATGGCLLYLGDGGALPADKKSPAGACRFAAASPYTPLLQPVLRGSRITRHQQRFTLFTRPVCPLPVTPGWNKGPSAFPRASHLAVTGNARRGWGQASEHGPGTTQPE